MMTSPHHLSNIGQTLHSILIGHFYTAFAGVCTPYVRPRAELVIKIDGRQHQRGGEA